MTQHNEISQKAREQSSEEIFEMSAALFLPFIISLGVAIFAYGAKTHGFWTTLMNISGSVALMTGTVITLLMFINISGWVYHKASLVWARFSKKEVK